MTLMRGLADDTPLMTWLTEHIWPAETKYLSEEYVYDGTELAIAEMLRSGTTCFADMYFFHNVAARAARKHGIRAALGAAIIEFPTPYAADAEAYIARALESRGEFAEASRLKLMLGPHAPYTVSDKTFIRVATIAEEAGFPVMLHVHETRDELTQSEKEYGVRPDCAFAKTGRTVSESNRGSLRSYERNRDRTIRPCRRQCLRIAQPPTSNWPVASLP